MGKFSNPDSSKRPRAEVRERSAGVIVYREPEPGETEPGETGRTYLLLDYGRTSSGRRHWDFAKGHLEAGESDLEAARRELAEETGITQCDLVEGFAREISYYFQARGKVVRKEVVFFLGKTAVREVRVSDEHGGFAWVGFEEALARLTFPTARELLRLAEGLLAGEEKVGE